MNFIKYILILFCFCLIWFSSFVLFGEALISTETRDFETLMGRQFPAWRYVETPDDFENLRFFKQVYEQNTRSPSPPSSSVSLRIPKIVHFIWLGPKPFPIQSVENVRTWIAKHPDWEFKFWTDRPRPLPHKNMQLMRLQDFQFKTLGECYKKSTNWGEKSDLLRYELLHKYGGVYVDHDVKCLRDFSELHEAYDFYCGLELPRETSLISSVLPTNSIIGSKADHSILQHCLKWLPLNWDQIEEDYPGHDRESTIERVSHRTFLILGEAFKEYGCKNGNRDIALPTFYFNAPDESLAIFSHHTYQGTWFENETTFEKAVRERLMKISKKINKLLLVMGCFSFIILVGSTVCFIHFRKISR